MSLDFYLVRIGKDEFGEEIRQEVFSRNITHNLTKMADAAGIYECLWHPEIPGIVYAKECIPILERGLDAMIQDPEKFKVFNARNGWGLYEHFVPFVRAVLEACNEHPNARVEVSI